MFGLLEFPDRDQYDLSSLRTTVTGAAVVPVELIQRLRSEMTFETIITGYGLTETSGTVSMCRYDDDPETIANFSGRAIPDTELDGRRTPTATRCRAASRVRSSPAATTSWWATSATPRRRPRPSTPTAGCTPATSGSWTSAATSASPTGMKDMYIVGGFNAYPAEIENLLLGNDKISQVAVVGVPDERMGEVGMAFVVPRPGTHRRRRRRHRVGRASTWPTTRCRATSRCATRCR